MTCFAIFAGESFRRCMSAGSFHEHVLNRMKKESNKESYSAQKLKSSKSMRQQ